MPCDSIQRSKVQFIQGVTNLDHLMNGMEKLGYTVTKTASGFSYVTPKGERGTYDSRTGQFETRGYYGNPVGVDVDEIKRGYSCEVVQETADQMGWQIEWRTNTETGFPEAEVMRRR